jgi:hypothetical protein
LHGNCLLKHVIEGKVEGRIGVKARRGRKYEQPPDDLKDTRRYWQLKGETLVRYEVVMVSLNVVITCIPVGGNERRKWSAN